MSGRLALCFAAIACTPLAARADIFVLANQGEVRGELVNKTESPRRTYVVLLPGGGEITLDKEQVSEVRRETPAQLDYERRRAAAGDTVAEHWELAEFCRKSQFLSSREQHLKRILELDTDHEGARRGLGYSRIDGVWKTQDQKQMERGYVKYKGEWKLPQEVELAEARRKAVQLEAEWKGNIKRWRGWLATDKSEKALELIEEINDPAAVPAIEDQLKNEKEFKYRKLWLETLGRIDSPDARSILVDVSLKDANLELRLTAVDELARTKAPDVVPKYVKALKGADNPTINRAAIGLGAMEDKSAIGPLIEVLVTTHTTTTTQGNSQSISTTFNTGGQGPSGLSVGARKQTYTATLANEDVRNALTRLSGVNFNFEIDRWKAWHAAQRADAAVNVRRD
jgi:hypothetical protein